MGKSSRTLHILGALGAPPNKLIKQNSVDPVNGPTEIYKPKMLKGTNKQKEIFEAVQDLPLHCFALIVINGFYRFHQDTFNI